MEFLGKVFLALLSGLVLPILLELWKGKRSKAADPAEMKQPSIAAPSAATAEPAVVQAPPTPAVGNVLEQWLGQDGALGVAARVLFSALYGSVLGAILAAFVAWATKLTFVVAFVPATLYFSWQTWGWIHGRD